MSEIADPFAQNVDVDDPFATPEDVRTVFNPTPPLEVLEGRVLVMVPRKFEDDAPIPDEFIQSGGPKVRDRYTVDMVVLTGGPVTFEYNGPAGKDGKRERLSATVTALPALFSGVWRVEASLIGQLRKVDGGPRPMLLGRLIRGPQAKDRKAGKTVEDVAAEFAAWRRNPKGNAPRFSWQMVVEGLSAEDKALAMDWYRTAVAGGYKL